jgi:hypothetical protein
MCDCGGYAVTNALPGDTAIIAYFLPCIRNLQDPQLSGVARPVDLRWCGAPLYASFLLDVWRYIILYALSTPPGYAY